MVRKVWFDDERPAQREARLKHEAELKRMAERQQREADRQRQKEAEWLAEEERGIRKATRTLEKIGRNFPDWATRFAQILEVYDALAEQVHPEYLESYGFDGTIRRVMSRQGGWNVREPYQGYEYVMLGRHIQEGFNSNHEPVVHVDLITPEIRRHGEAPGRNGNQFGYGEFAPSTQRRVTVRHRVKLAPPALSLSLLPRLPANLSKHMGMIGIMAVTRDDPLREFAIDRESMMLILNRPEPPTGGWSDGQTVFGMRRHFGYNETPWRPSIK